jgi:hypothetical protein
VHAPRAYRCFWTALSVSDLLEVEVTDDPPQHVLVDLALAPELDERCALGVEELADQVPVGIGPAVERLVTGAADAGFVPIAPQAVELVQASRSFALDPVLVDQLIEPRQSRFGGLDARLRLCAVRRRVVLRRAERADEHWERQALEHQGSRRSPKT